MKENDRKSILMITIGNWNHASSRIRAMEYIPMLEATECWHVTHLSRVPQKGRNLPQKILFAIKKRLYTLRRLWLLLTYPWDIVIVFKFLLSDVELSILKWRQIPWVFDFDDALYVGKGYARTKKMVESANSLIVSSETLGEFCRKHGREITLIPSPVDCTRIQVKTPEIRSRSEPIRIGWIGSSWTEHYLSVIEEVLRLVAQEIPLQLYVIGTSDKFNLEGLEMRKITWKYEKEAENLQQIDIGVMPLSDDEWSRGKGGYKLLQYMAAGIPVVASPVGINRSIVDDSKTGYLASNSKEWKEALLHLCTDPEKRIKMGMAGRVKVEKFYSYTFCFPLMNEVLCRTTNANYE